jgi:hypothetical protein
MGVAERSEYDRGCGNSFAAAFSRALLDREGEAPSLVAGPYGKGTLKRYNVYRNNVTVSLISALASIYPAVQRITGMEFYTRQPSNLAAALRIRTRFPRLHRPLRVC